MMGSDSAEPGPSDRKGDKVPLRLASVVSCSRTGASNECCRRGSIRARRQITEADPTDGGFLNVCDENEDE
jgi:hypothetical protein